MNKNTIDAYHKITAPKGLKERIEANVLAEQEARSVRRNRWWKEIRMPAATVFAAAVICLIVWAGGAGMSGLIGEKPGTEMRMGISPRIVVMSENGSVLGSEETVLEVYSGDMTAPNVLLAGSNGIAPAEENGEEDSAKAVVLQVGVTDVSTFRADSDALSVYLVNEMLWTEPCSELILKMDGELCVLLPAMGDGEVFNIEISSAETKSTITIVYDETAGRYLASCQENTGK